jgi:hypothetical protein
MKLSTSALSIMNFGLMTLKMEMLAQWRTGDTHFNNNKHDDTHNDDTQIGA